MERKIYKSLMEWKEKDHRLPLILNGARQVGKTYILRKFGEEQFENTVYVNLETDGRVRSLFEEDLSPQKIIEQMELLTASKVISGKTLLFLDEIQACERALTSMKAFAEQMHDLHIVTAGSLLGVALNRERYSFPVGYVDELSMFPFDFEEFLWAMNKKELADNIRIHFTTDEPFTNAYHEAAMEQYRNYLVIGGMPAAINAYLQHKSLLDVTDPQQRILNEYVADMAKYAQPSTSVKIRACYNSIPTQLAKENKKFQYKVVQKGGTATIFGESIDWLQFAGLVLKCQKVDHGFLPISVYSDFSDFKLYMSDVGLLTRKSEMPISILISPLPQDNTFMGGIAENYVAQALAANQRNLFYWKNENRGELDFVIQVDNEVIPIEVKKGSHTKAKSMDMFRKKYNCETAIRISSHHFGRANGIKSVPLYAVFCI